MRKFVQISTLASFLVCLLTFQVVEAQVVLKLNLEKSTMTIDGTSTLHDWTSKVNQIEGQIEVADKVVKKLSQGAKFDKVVFAAEVKSIESGRGNTMDNRTYEALKGDEHPQVTFTLVDGSLSQIKGNEFTMNAKGDLSIAGVTKPIELEVNGKQIDKETFTFSGSKGIDMTEFSIKPPTAMFGTIETGKDVTIKFDLVFNR